MRRFLSWEGRGNNGSRITRITRIFVLGKFLSLNIF